MDPAELQSYAREAARQYGIPEDLYLRLLRKESGFRVDRKSKAGAYGPAQLTALTAEHLGVNRYDPIENVRGGAQYLSELYERFGTWPLALAAYNAGPTRVRKAGDSIPRIRETEEYIANILAGVPLEGEGIYEPYVGTGGARPPPPRPVYIEGITAMLDAETKGERKAARRELLAEIEGKDMAGILSAMPRARTDVPKYADGGAVSGIPRETTIAGQRHMLAYINPFEEDLLRQYGGSGIPGPGGVPAYPPAAVERERRADMDRSRSRATSSAGSGTSSAGRADTGSRSSSPAREREGRGDRVSTPAGMKSVNTRAAGTREGGVSYSAPTTADVRSQATAGARIGRDNAARSVAEALSRGSRMSAPSRAVPADRATPAAPAEGPMGGFGALAVPTTPVGSSRSALLPGSTITPAQAVSGLMERGVPLHVAQGLAANIADESAFNAAAIGDAGKSGGLFQHYGVRPGGRFDSLKKLAEAKGTTWDDPSVQLDMAAAELGFLNDPMAKDLGIFGSHAGVGERLMNAKGPNQAADIALRQFEIPAERYISRRSAEYLSMTDFPAPLGSLEPAPLETRVVDTPAGPKTVTVPRVGAAPAAPTAAASPPSTTAADVAVAEAMWGKQPAKGGIMGMGNPVTNTRTFQNLPKEQQIAAQVAGALIPGASLVQGIGYALNDREMRAATEMLQGTYQGRQGLFGFGADPEFARAEPVYDERTGQLIGAMGYNDAGEPVMYRGQRQGVRYSGEGADMVQPVSGLGGGDREGPEDRRTEASETPASDISVECPPGFRYDPVTKTCVSESGWGQNKPPAWSGATPPAYTQVPDFRLQPLLPYQNRGIMSVA